MKLGYNWLHIFEVMIVFCFSVVEGARKLVKLMHIFASPGKPNYKNPRRFLYRVKEHFIT